jgi:cholesterol transport system auxiliary component
MVLRFALASAVALVLTGCGAISALDDATTTLSVYDLRAADQPRAARQTDTHIIVELPNASGALDTDRIMIRPDPLQAQYLPDVRWSDPVPAMVQTLMLRSLESTDAASYVGRRPLGPGGDFAVLTELVDFQAELDPGGETATVRVEMIVRLLRERDTRVVASRTFRASAVAPSTETPAVVAAFDTAVEALMTAFTSWTLESVGARPGESR